MKANAGEVYTVYNQYLKRYTACQVAYIAPPDTVSKESWAVVLSLDWVGDAPLTAEELPHLRPLYKDFMYWSRDLHLLRVPLEVPPQYTLVGTLPPFTDQPCRSYGGWNDGYEVYRQIKWQEIPEERRRAFKEAMESDGEPEIGGIPVKVTGPVHEVLVERMEMGQFLRGQRGVAHPIQREDHRPGLLAHRVRRCNIGHLTGGVAFQVLVVDRIDRSGASFHGAAILSSVLFQVESPHAVGELPGGKAVDLPVDLHLIDMKHFFRAVMGIDDRRCFPAVAPAVLKDIYAKQRTLPIETGCFKFPCHFVSLTIPRAASRPAAPAPRRSSSSRPHAS